MSVEPQRPARPAALDEQSVFELANWVFRGGPLAGTAVFKPPRGILFSGPRGGGKFHLARRVCDSLSVSLLSAHGVDILDRYHASGPDVVSELFARALAQAPGVLFIDAIHLLAPRDVFSQCGPHSALAARLLVELDRLPTDSRILVVGATARPDALAIEVRRRGRLDREVVVSVPDRMARVEILRQALAQLNPADGLDFEEIGRRSSGYTGDDLWAVCQEAVLSALRRSPQAPALTLDDFMAALRLVEPSAASELFTEKPTTRWAHIGGMQRAKQRLQEQIEWPLRYADLYARAGVPRSRGVLLCGAPGTGKTMLARAVASESGAAFLALRGSVFHSTYDHPAEVLREAFRRARLAAPCILFLDEIDELLKGDLTACFRAEMSSISGLRGVAVLAATSRLDHLDSSLLGPGYIEEVIDLTLPDETERREILEMYLRLSLPATNADLASLARASDGCSGADLRAICDHAARASLHRAIQKNSTQNVVIEPLDFESAIADHRQRQRRHFL